jgi:imidazolonepropionase-like amidohydrolase
MQSGIVRRFVSLLVLAALVAICHAYLWPVRQAQADEPRYFAIQHARIVPVSGPVIEDGTVVVSKGLIAAVGTNVPIPPEAWVIDGKSLTVYPGLIDAGTDLGLPKPEGASGGPAGSGGAQPPRQIAMGPEDRPGTTPWLRPADELKPEDKRIRTWRNAGFTSALVLPKGGIFPGQGSVINLAGERASAMVVKAPAALDLSFQPIGGFWSFPGSLMGVVAYVRQVFIDARWHAEAERVYEAHTNGLERPPYDRTERVVGGVVRDRELVLVPANNEIQIRRAIRLVHEWELHATLYGGQQGYAVSDAIAAQKLPVLVNLKWPEKDKDADPDDEVTLRELRFRDRAPSTPAAFAKVGVKFAFYSEGLPGPPDIMKNVRKAIAAGLAPDAALRAFTLDAAEILGVGELLGSIQPGKIANLVVTDGDIFNEKTKVKLVFVDGRRFEVHEEEKPKDKDKDKDDKKPERGATTKSGASSRSGGIR